MNIPWKIKSLMFRGIQLLGAYRLLYFAQRNITGRSNRNLLSGVNIWKRHRETVLKYNLSGSIFEFGAGKSLGQNLFLSSHIDKQVVTDLNKMIDMRLLNGACKEISNLSNITYPSKFNSIEDLKKIGIEYIAPLDASTTHLPDESMDGCLSTNTLEHVPIPTIRLIIKELKRILKPNAIVAAQIDYSDHYAHTDRSITWLNFLRFNEIEWERYNHGCHFQNRLRHSQYIELFEAAGFQMIEEEVEYGEKNIPPVIREKFQDAQQTWSATSGYVVFRKINK